MILLQAAMMAGYLMLIFYGLFLFAGILVLLNPCMKLFWNLFYRNQKLTSGLHFYKYPLPFILSLIVSAGLTTFTFFGLILILGGIFLVTFD
jgi:hypothetical protein